MQADRGDVRVALQQLLNVVGEWVQHAWPSLTLHFHRFCSVLLVAHQDTGHALAGDSQQLMVCAHTTRGCWAQSGS